MESQHFKLTSSDGCFTNNVHAGEADDILLCISVLKTVSACAFIPRAKFYFVVK